MVKLLLFLSLLFLISNGAQASNWNNLSPGQSYKLKENLKITESNLNLKKGTSLKLVEKSDLNMIKIKFFKYQINNCQTQNKESALELVKIKQSQKDKVSVGVTLAKDCMLEVFVQESDFKSETFFI